MISFQRKNDKKIYPKLLASLRASEFQTCFRQKIGSLSIFSLQGNNVLRPKGFGFDHSHVLLCDSRLKILEITVLKILP